MSLRIHERTHLPPDVDLNALLDLLDSALENGSTGLTIQDSNGDQVAIPPEITKVVAAVVVHMNNSHGVIVSRAPKNMTIQEAADFLEITPRELGDLMETGALPSDPRNEMRPIRLADAIRYSYQRCAEQDEALNRLVELSHDYGLYDLDQWLAAKQG